MGAATSPARATPSYSIDSFSEFSCFAVSRTPSTSAIDASPPAIGAMFEPRTTQEQDEELFRDLFAADNDWEYLAPPSQQQRLSQKQAALGQHKASKATPIWSTGGSVSGGGSPFLSVAFGASPLVQSPSVEPPTLSAPVPRLNLAELMNARPGDGGSSNVWGGTLCQLPEEADEEDDLGDDDSEENEDRSESNAKFKAKSTSELKLKTSKLKPTTSSIINNNSSVNNKLRQETLSFLEKLDLKALLHTPRPDVLDFYPTSSVGGPTGSSTGTGVSTVNQFASRSDNPRVETGRDRVASVCNAFNSSNLVKGKPTSGKAPSKKKPAASSSEVSSRLSHMESTYGTTKSEPRKARKGTINRLANPILGYTSTLQALSPDQRRRREAINMEEDDEEERAERGWKDNSGNSAAVGVKPRRKESREHREASSNPLSHLTTSAQVYEAASSSSSRRLQKRPANWSRETSNNQLEDERDNNNNQSLPVKCKPTTGEKKKAQSLSARKAALKKKIEEKQSERSSQSAFEYSVPVPSAIASATFLTQHVEEEEKLSSHNAVKREAPQFRRLSLPSSIPPVPNNSSEFFSSRQPQRPVSVRDPKKQELSSSSRPTQSSRRVNNYNANDEREARGSVKKSQSKQFSVGKPTYREMQNKPKRPSGSRQQPAAPVATLTVPVTAAAPRKPSNDEQGKPSGWRPCPRASTGSSASGAQAKAGSSATSVPKRKQSVGKASASEMLLMGAKGQSSASTAAATPRRGNSSTRKARKVQVYTPKKVANNSSSVPGNATSKEKPTTRWSSRETTNATTKSSMVLPSIHPPKVKQPAESGVRRNFVYRRTKAN